MAHVPRGLLILAVASASPLAAGCGPGTVPVAGVVTVDDRPLAGAFVLYIPEGPGGREASGSTDADGRFQLSTYRRHDGALPGRYRVTITYSAPAEPAPQPRTPDEIQTAITEGGAASKPGLVLPAIYSQPDRTILRRRVPEDGEVKLELKSQER